LNTLFTNYDGVGMALFVNTKKEIETLTEKSEKSIETEAMKRETHADAETPAMTDEAKPKNEPVEDPP
jgi:hypothetical protein